MPLLISAAPSKTVSIWSFVCCNNMKGREITQETFLLAAWQGLPAFAVCALLTCCTDATTVVIMDRKRDKALQQYAAEHVLSRHDADVGQMPSWSAWLPSLIRETPLDVAG